MAMDLREQFFNELVDKLNKEEVKRLKISNPANGKTLKLNGIVLCKISKNNPYKDAGLVIWKHLTQAALDLVGGMRAKGKKDWAAAPLTIENYSNLNKLLVDVAIKSKSFKTTMRPKRTRKRTPKQQTSSTTRTLKITEIGNINYNTGEEKLSLKDEESISQKVSVPTEIKIKAKKRKKRR